MEGFKTHLEGQHGHSTQRQHVAYCLPFFTTKGCANSMCCNLCHDIPVESSDEWGYLRDALLSDIGQRRLMDDPTFDVLPIIKERGVAISRSTPAAAADNRRHSTGQDATESPVSYSDHQSASVGPSYGHHSSSRHCNNLNIDTNNIPTSSALSTLPTGDDIGWGATESTVKHTSTALVRAVSTAVTFAVKGIDKSYKHDKSSKLISSAPAVSYGTEPALCSTPSILDRIKSPQPKPTKVAKNNCNPCINYQSESGCHCKCGLDHSKPEIGSEAWYELREDLKRCTKHFRRETTIEPLVYLGMDKGFTSLRRDSDEPLVDYCYPSFTTLGCFSQSCRRCHLLPIDGSTEWSLLKVKLISYVEGRLARTPALDFTPIIKDRGVTVPRIPCFWYYTEDGCSRLNCPYSHDRPRIGSPEWYLLRQALIDQGSPWMKLATPCAYLGFPSFNRDALSTLYRDNKPIVAFCIPRFTSKGCEASDCMLCHEFPLPSSNEGIALQEQLSAYASSHQGVQPLDLRIQYCRLFFTDGGKCPYGPSCTKSHYKYTTANDMYDFTQQMNEYIGSM